MDSNFVLIAEALVLCLYNVAGSCSCFLAKWDEKDSVLGDECAADGYAAVFLSVTMVLLIAAKTMVSGTHGVRHSFFQNHESRVC